MPLNTRIIRDGEPLQIRWGDFHVAAMVCAAAYDSGQGPFEGEQKPAFRYGEGDHEWANRTADEYPEVPCPITPRDSFTMADYYVIATTPLNDGEYVLKGEHRFLDCMDGEILHLLPGDVLQAWRSGNF